MNLARRKFAVAALALSMAAGSGAAFAEAEKGEWNEIHLLLDTSGSFRNLQAKAIEQARGLLDQLAARRQRRYEKSDRVVVWALDAIPERVWSGTPAELAEIDAAGWKKRFSGRADLAGCTDLTRGFELAAGALAESQPTFGFIWAWTDLHHEPPLGSVRASACLKNPRPTSPPKSFPFEALRDYAVQVFWAPADAKLHYERAAREVELTRFQVHTASESGVMAITPPPKARRVITAEERARTGEEVIKAGTAIGKGVLWVAGFIGLMGVLVLIGGLIHRARRRDGRPVRPGTGQVAPLRLPVAGAKVLPIRGRPGGSD